MELLESALLDISNVLADEGLEDCGRRREAPSYPAHLVVERVRRSADACLLTMSGDLSQASAEVAISALTTALCDSGRVVVDVSGLRLRSTSAVHVFASAPAAVGGWPRARLVLIGAGALLADALVTHKVTETVPLAADEATARQLMLHRPPAVARHLDLGDDSSSPRRARLFVGEASRDWGFDAVRDDAVLVASELVANAVAHARTPCRLDLRLDALGLTVTVHDYDFRGLLVPLACSVTGHRDHGLFLVASISRAWGVSPTGNGKSVWALLPFPSGG